MSNHSHLSSIPQRDIFQPIYQYNIQIKFYHKIIQHFPDLSHPTADIVSRAIVNKLCEGVHYPIELEEIIQKIYPVIVSSQ